MARALAESVRPGPGVQIKRQVMRAIEVAARQLGNTVAVCRKCYVHPAVIEA